MRSKRIFAEWQAAYPERKPTWTSQPVPAPTSRYDQARPDRDLVSRFSGNPPFGYDTRNGDEARPTFVARSAVAGLDVLVLEQGRRDANTPNAVSDRVTAVSLDLPRPRHRLSVYRRSGYQRAAWYRSMAFWRFRTGDPAFDAQFQVDTANRQEARLLLPPAVTNFRHTIRVPHISASLWTEQSSPSGWRTNSTSWPSRR
jgi:hypothetical protein